MTQLSLERYEAEARSDHRTYARDHDYAEWCHYIRFHVLGEINYSLFCSPVFEREKEKRASLVRQGLAALAAVADEEKVNDN